MTQVFLKIEKWWIKVSMTFVCFCMQFINNANKHPTTVGWNFKRMQIKNPTAVKVQLLLNSKLYWFFTAVRVPSFSYSSTRTKVAKQVLNCNTEAVQIKYELNRKYLQLALIFWVLSIVKAIAYIDIYSSLHLFTFFSCVYALINHIFL
jgi:hypothetical protein